MRDDVSTVPGYARHSLAALTLALMLAGASAWANNTTPLHDPMRPLTLAAISSSGSGEDTEPIPLPQLNATIITEASRVAVFGLQHLHVGEHINAWQIKSIEPGLVTLSNGTEQRHIRLAPILIAPDKNGR